MFRLRRMKLLEIDDRFWIYRLRQYKVRVYETVFFLYIKEVKLVQDKQV